MAAVKLIAIVFILVIERRFDDMTRLLSLIERLSDADDQSVEEIYQSAIDIRNKIDAVAK